jgi:MYXO-CTERM domain-containing protein
MFRFVPALWLVPCLLLLATPAQAQTCRDPGTPPAEGTCLCNWDEGGEDRECIPVGGSRLGDLFASDHPPAEGIDVVTDGNTTPETFVPDCEIVFEFMLRAAGFNNVFGWYNVTGEKPEDSTDELFTILDSGIHCADWDDRCDGSGDREFNGSGHVATVEIAADPQYLGGEIGFFLKTPEGCGDSNAAIGRDCGYLYFSERRWNDDVNPDGDPTYVPTDDDYIHLLTYNSLVESGFYFAWEDLFEGGDNDFADVVTYVSNIVCSGAGGACEVPGEEGICAQGSMQCRSGVLECVAHREPRAEECNGLDDDCNGLIDDGDDLCGPTEVCRFGQCIERCQGGEISCPIGQTCVSNVCVENACVGVDCDPGQRCVGGDCVDGCTGVVCPQGQQCDPFVGACVDPCAGLDCEGNQVCIDGLCQAPCECQPQRCESQDLVCGGDGLCLDEDCVDVTCDEGSVCQGGACVDACSGVSCPSGQVCELGQCVPGDPSGGDGGVGGGDGGVGDDGGVGGDDGGVGGGDGGIIGDGGAIGPGDDDGCGCSVPGTAAGGLPGAAAFALLAGLVLWRRRRSGA